MSKEKQIKETTELLWHFPKALHLNCYNDCEQVAELLYNEGYRKTEWISVDERLPELLQDVLCYRGNFKGDLMNTYTYLGQEMWKDDYGINYSTEEDGITHWMPLPEPPMMKGGE